MVLEKVLNFVFDYQYTCKHSIEQNTINYTVLQLLLIDLMKITIQKENHLVPTTINMIRYVYWDNNDLHTDQLDLNLPMVFVPNRMKRRLHRPFLQEILLHSCSLMYPKKKKKNLTEHCICNFHCDTSWHIILTLNLLVSINNFVFILYHYAVILKYTLFHNT